MNFQPIKQIPSDIADFYKYGFDGLNIFGVIIFIIPIGITGIIVSLLIILLALVETFCTKNKD